MMKYEIASTIQIGYVAQNIRMILFEIIEMFTMNRTNLHDLILKKHIPTQKWNK